MPEKQPKPEFPNATVEGLKAAGNILLGNEPFISWPEWTQRFKDNVSVFLGQLCISVGIDSVDQTPRQQ